jgi:MFS family permease
VLAGIAFGSAVSGFSYGSRRWRTPVLRRFRLQAAAFATLPLLFLLAANVPMLAVIGFVVGLGIAPTLITSFTLIQEIVPAAALTEGTAWLTTGLSIGYGAAAALVGGIADAHGARVAFLITVGCGLEVGALAFVLYRRLAGRPQVASPAVVGSV